MSRDDPVSLSRVCRYEHSSRQKVFISVDVDGDEASSRMHDISLSLR